MFGGMDPKKMQAVMKQMGIKQEAVDALRVVIEKEDGSRTVIHNPSVVKIMMQGQESWQITGEAQDEGEDEGISEGDIELVMEKTGKPYDVCRDALTRSEGDIAACIVALSQ
ncbi:MAG: nascent polypeptide-associated complex protein [Candidatus Pacearchaeota archaeon]